jgi:hypothetical protein
VCPGKLNGNILFADLQKLGFVIFISDKNYMYFIYTINWLIYFFIEGKHTKQILSFFLHLIIVSLIIAKRLMSNFSISTCKLKESIWVILEFNNYISITTLHVCFLEKLLVIGKPWLEYKNIKNLSDIIKSIV